MRESINIDLIDTYLDNDLLNLLVKNFENSVPIEIENLIASVKDDNEQEALKVVHKLKNLFLNVGSIETAKIFQDIEDDFYSVNKYSIKSFENLLNYEYQLTHKSLRTYLENRKH
ncbi:MAG: hypothetical protein HOO06_09015 [Bdellovibrionaceae bacterium]|jgi:hypothetical protein|nr:hypothetical protein [Pseudobdellovibrionaceae bacterium]